MSRVFIASFFMLLLVAAAFALLSAAPQAAAQAPPPYKCYQITGPAPTVTPVALQTQFGTEPHVVVGAPGFLCEPAAKTLPPITPTPPSPPDTPYKAYNITDTNTLNARVNLKTQLGNEYRVLVGQAKFLWEPAKKDGVGDLTQTPYKCYQITNVGTPVPNTVNLLTHFGLEQNVLVNPAQYLCEPALKNGVGDLAATPYKCYGISNTTAPVHAPVNLETQFGTEPNVAVGLAQLLCEPASKQASVGGVAELPEAASGSGSSAGTYAALAAGLAAAVLALTAGAWYARRRWVR